MTTTSALSSLPFLFLAFGCHPKAVSNEADAARAYLGLDAAIPRAMNLGMDGYNEASSANIDAQAADGDLAGTLTVTGQVDQGESDNKELRLQVALAGYLDDTVDGDTSFAVTYETDAAAPPELDLSLRGIPDGTLTGTLVGDVRMSDDLAGWVTLDLAFDGEIEAGADGTAIVRADGATHITGTATSDYGSWSVDLTR